MLKTLFPFNPTLELAMKLAKLLRVSVEELFLIED